MINLKNQRGYALVSTLILIVIITVLGTTLLFSLSTEIKMNKSMEQKAIATYLAQAGIEHGLTLLENDLDFENTWEIILQSEKLTQKYKVSNPNDNTIISIGVVEINGVEVSKISITAEINDGIVTIKN